MKTCLCMIVKDSGEILRQTLRSFLPHVDYFCICDTGSTDNTPQILLEETELYSGYLFKEPFVDFSHNRNLVLEAAEKMYPDCYYITIDDTYLLENPGGFDEFFEQASDPSYLIFIRNEETQYLSVKVSTKGMRYRYRIHEILDSPQPPKVVKDFYFREQRPEDHRQRTAARAEFDLVCLRKDLQENPKDPRLMFYIGRTLYNQDKLLEAAQWFKERVQLDTGSRWEKYQSMVYIALIAERTHHTPQELLGLFLGIYKMFPEYKEPLFYAAINAAEMGKHDQAIELLEKSYNSPHRSEFCDKHVIAEKEVPRMLCSYYFKTNVEKCVPFLFKHYIQQELPFDYAYESYLRHIFRFNPKALFPTAWVVYSDNLTTADFFRVFPQFASASDAQKALVCDDSQEEMYRQAVCHYAIKNLLVLNRVDRIAFFPNVVNVYLMLTKDAPQGGSLECFPSLRGVICKTDLHATKLKETYLSPSASRLLITMPEFLLFLGNN